MMHDLKSLAEEIAWRTCCPDQKACPAPARSMCSRWSYVAPAADFLTALLAARPDVAAVLNGEAVAVPRETVDAFARVWRINAPLNPDPQRPLADFIPGAWPKLEAAKAMNDALAASPYAQEPKA